MKLQKLYRTSTIDLFSIVTQTEMPIPFVDEGISAGFPSPAQDFIDIAIDLNKELVRNPSSTFYGRVKGDSMRDMGINDGDLLVIDRSLVAQNGKIAVCCLDGDFIIKKIKIEKTQCWLIAANQNYPPIRVTAENEFLVWGIVVHVIKSF